MTYGCMDGKDGDNLELQTLLNGKEEKQNNEGGKQKKSIPLKCLNGKSFLKGWIVTRFCSVFSKAWTLQ